MPSTTEQSVGERDRRSPAHPSRRVRGDRPRGGAHGSRPWPPTGGSPARTRPGARRTPDATGTGHARRPPGGPGPTPRRCCPTPSRTASSAPPPPPGWTRSCCAGCTRQLVRGRRYNRQATALTQQGRLAVYPSTTGQEACEVAAALVPARAGLALPQLPRHPRRRRPRASTPCEALTLLRGDWHTGYDPREHRVAPLCTPLATQLPHAVGLAHAARLRGDDTVALAMVGDGGTSEGDFHEALNFAAVWQAPVVFLVQNNGFAISVPLAKQTAAPVAGPQGRRLRDARAAWSTATTRPPCTRCSPRRCERARARRRPDPRRGRHLPHRGPHQRRRRHPLPRRRRGRAPGASTTRSRCWSASCASRGLLDDDGMRGRARGRPRTMAAALREQHERRPGARPDGPVRPRLRRARPPSCASRPPSCAPNSTPRRQ